MLLARTLDACTRLISCCLLVQLAISTTLWKAERSYPFLPFLENQGVESWNVIAPYLTGMAGLALILLLLGWQQRIIFSFLLTAFVILIFLDLNRLQVWLYLLTLLLLVLSFKSPKRDILVFWTLRLVLPLVYIWSALHKINPYYSDLTFSWLMGVFSWTAPWKESICLSWGSILLELVIGLALYFQKTRMGAAILGIIFHLILLLFLGPFGHDWNSVVWPWNMAMIGLLFLLYFKTPPEAENFSIKKLLRFPIAILLFVLLGIMPAFNRLALWDEALSFKMYAGTASEGILYFQEADISCLPEKVQGHIKAISIDSLDQPQQYLLIDKWAFEEMKVSPYASARRLSQLARSFCTCVNDPTEAGIELLEVYPPKGQEKERTYTCRELLLDN